MAKEHLDVDKLYQTLMHTLYNPDADDDFSTNFNSLALESKALIINTAVETFREKGYEGNASMIEGGFKRKMNLPRVTGDYHGPLERARPMNVEDDIFPYDGNLELGYTEEGLPQARLTTLDGLVQIHGPVSTHPWHAMEALRALLPHYTNEEQEVALPVK